MLVQELVDLLNARAATGSNAPLAAGIQNPRIMAFFRRHRKDNGLNVLETFLGFEFFEIHSFEGFAQAGDHPQ